MTRLIGRLLLCRHATFGSCLITKSVYVSVPVCLSFCVYVCRCETEIILYNSVNPHLLKLHYTFRHGKVGTVVTYVGRGKGEAPTCTTADEMVCIFAVCTLRTCVYAWFLKSQWSINCGAATILCLSFGFLFHPVMQSKTAFVYKATFCFMWWQPMMLTLKPLQIHTDSNVPGHESETILMTEQSQKPVVSHKSGQ